MAKRPPQKGAIEFVALHPEISDDEKTAGVEIGIRHVGPRQAREWARRFAAIRDAEQNRIRKIRREVIEDCGGDRGAAAEEAPHVFADGFATPDADAEYEALFSEMFAAAIGAVRGVEGLSEESEEEAQAYCEYLDTPGLLKLALAILDQQSLTPRQFFRSPDSRDAGRDGSA